MLTSRQRLLGARCPSWVVAQPALRRVSVVPRADKDKWSFGSIGKGGQGGDDSSRKGLEGAFGKFGFGQKGTPADPPATSKGGGMFGGMFGQGGGGGGSGPGGGGGGGGGGFVPQPEGGGSGPEKPILQDLLEFLQGTATVVVNTALFLGFACMLHRSLDWCCQVELLLLVGAPQQAWERVAARLFGMVEWVEKHLLGWDIPGDEDMIPMYENIALYYPEEHAYTFDAYRYNMTEDEKKKLKYTYALRHYERDGGKRGDVSPQDVQKIFDKYEPLEADRREYLRLKAAGRLEEYWSPERMEQCQRVVSMRK